MHPVFHPILHWIAAAAESELVHHVEYLKTENEILRAKIDKPIRTAAERLRLVTLGKKCGDAIKGLVTIVKPETFRDWVKQIEDAAVGKTDEAPKEPASAKPGRPRTPEEIRDLVLKLRLENPWGFTRILGELKKLGINVSRSTVRNILLEAGFDDAPAPGPWSQFIKAHSESLYACDFFSKNGWTFQGVKQMFVLAFIHVESRIVWTSPPTANPNAAWVAKQAEAFVDRLGSDKPREMILLRDNHGKFQGGFDDRMAELGVEVKPTPVRAPNANAYIERWIQSVKTECLDHFIVVGDEHLNHIVQSYVEFYNERRPHQNKDNQPLGLYEPPDDTRPPPKLDEIECESRLSGVLKSYSRKAA